MATISFEETQKTARLSKLELTMDEIDKLSTQLSDIVGYIDKLKEVESKNSENAEDKLHDNLREDIFTGKNRLSPSEALSQASKTKDGQFEVSYVFNSSEE